MYMTNCNILQWQIVSKLITGGQLNATAEISAQPIVEGVPLVEAASLRTTPTPRSTVSNPSATLRLSRESILQRSTHPYNRQRAGFLLYLKNKTCDL